MTPLVKEFIKACSTLDYDPIQLQWFDVSEAIKANANVNPKNYLLNPAPYKHMALVGGFSNMKVLLILLVDPAATLVHGFAITPESYRTLGSFLFAEHEGVPKTGPLDMPPEPQDQAMMVKIIAAFYASLDKPIQSYSPTPHKANASRAKRGLKPLYDWHTVVIEPPKPKQEHQGGTHASPRRHQARGHWRNCKSGKRVWVKECWRGDASKGTVFKDYEIKENT